MVQIYLLTEKLSETSCLHSKAIDPNSEEKQSGIIAIPYRRVDRYPSFPALLASSREGCDFCGLLRSALQDQYSDEKIAKAESDFDASIRDNWRPTEWDCQVTIDGAVLYTEEYWPERDESQGSDQTLDRIYMLSFYFWPYLPGRDDIEPRDNYRHIYIPTDILKFTCSSLSVHIILICIPIDMLKFTCSNT